MVWTVRGLIPGWGTMFFFLLQDVQTSSAAHPAFYSGTVKRPVRESDHLPPSSAVVKNYWSYTLTPLYALIAWTGTTLPFYHSQSKHPTFR